MNNNNPKNFISNTGNSSRIVKEETNSSTNSNKIKIYATIFPYEIKIILMFPGNMFISEMKNYLTDTVRGLNIGSFQCGKITNEQDYILLPTLVSIYILFFIQIF
jgi:hypothetical protein